LPNNDNNDNNNNNNNKIYWETLNVGSEKKNYKNCKIIHSSCSEQWSVACLFPPSLSALDTDQCSVAVEAIGSMAGAHADKAFYCSALVQGCSVTKHALFLVLVLKSALSAFASFKNSCNV
jgi:hypothetical protein